MTPNRRLRGATLIATAAAMFAPAVSSQTIAGLPPEPGESWPHPVSPPANPFPRNSTGTPAELALRDDKVRLGKLLFWDEQVSIDNTMACGSCHAIGAGGTDDRLGAVFTGGGVNDGNFGAFGVIPQSVNSDGAVVYGDGTTVIDRQVTPLHTPTMIGAFMFTQQFWEQTGSVGPDFPQEDGTAFPGGIFANDASLEAQAVRPPVSAVEMGHFGMLWSDGRLSAKLDTSRPLALVDPATIPPDVAPLVSSGANYKRLFDVVFQNDPNFGGFIGVTRERFAMAVAHYERTLVPDEAPIDLGQMTPNQIAGFNIMKRFNSVNNPTGRARCFFCHSISGDAGGINPPLVGSGGPLANPLDQLLSDGQRNHQIGLAPGVPQRKTPTLRNLGLRKKFFSTGHGGDGVTKIMVTNLDELITFYDNQPVVGINLGFTGTLTAAERASVRDFLENALTDPRVANEQFPFDRPQLAALRPEFNPVSGNEYGTGTAGPSGLVPEVLANVPPLVTKPLPGGGLAPSWFKVGVGNAPAAEFCALLFSGSAATGPLRWITFPVMTATPGVTDAQGIGTSLNPFPLDSAAIGVPVFVQWMVRDGAGFGASNAARFVPFQF